MCIRSIKGCLSSVDVRLRRVNPVRALEDFPERIQEEIDGDSNVRGDEVLVAPWRPDVEAVEDDNEGEVDEGEVGEVWLEGRLEDEGVAVDALGFEGLVELNVCEADAAPGEETGDCGQVLEPFENDVRATGAGQVCQEGD